MIAVNRNAHEFLSGRNIVLPDFLHSVEIKNLCFDSREVTQGDAFVVMPSVAGNEQVYVDAALKQGAVIVITEVSVAGTNQVVDVSDVLALSADLLNEAYSYPSKSLNVIGVTGTNGKSSISFYLAQVLGELSKPCGVMGTLGYGHWNSLTETGMTTLPLEKLHSTLGEMVSQYEAVAMEVSSHGLDQRRLAGVHFEAAIFSNLSRDHLDYHGTMEEYGAAKAKLFIREGLKLAVINVDDEFGKQLIQTTTAQQVVSYGMNELADVRFEINRLSDQGLELSIHWQGEVHDLLVPLYGQFNAYNIAAVIAYGVSVGLDIQSLLLACHAVKAVPGRMERVEGQDGSPMVIVDYAHTPDALEQVISAVKAHNAGQITVVVGCGGDRDKGKRPLMGKIAVQSADNTIFTSDNPRSESPEGICQEMAADLVGEVPVILDRKQAIEQAIMKANANDVVLIAGKGHETYQEIMGERTFFSDVQCAEQALQVEKLA